MSSRTRQICKATLGVAVFAVLVSGWNAFYWWWRLGMLWTPDELPDLRFQFRLWIALLALAIGLTAITSKLVFRRSHENAA